MEFHKVVRRVLAHPAVEANAGRVDLTRGPLVYCAEGVVNSVSLRGLALDDAVALRTTHIPKFLGATAIIRDDAPARSRAVPYRP